MKHFKNTELAKLYRVSEKSVRNWIQSANQGKLELELHQDNGRSYIANTTKNAAIIEQLVQKGKKYKNTRGFKTLIPKKEFYDAYNHKQIIDILSSIAVHHETPIQYGYVNGGAEDWDRYTKKLIKEEAPNLLTSTQELIDRTANNVEYLMANFSKLNVVDLGPGNAAPIRPVLERLSEQGKLGRYVAIDMSQDMLDIAEKNIKEWFGDSIKFESHIRDFSYERFTDLLDGGFASNDKDTANLVFLLGGTLANFRSPEQILQTVNNSLGINDLFICAGDLDTPATRRYFDFTASTQQKVPALDGQIIYFLNIDDTLYDVEWSFNEKEQARNLCILPKMDLSIKLELPGGPRCIELYKQEPLLLWRHRHYDYPKLIGLFDRCGFDMVLAAASGDQNHFLITTKIKTGLV